MSIDIDQNQLRVAIDWINKLANGMNPIDDSILPDSDIVNKVHVSRYEGFSVLNNICRNSQKN